MKQIPEIEKEMLAGFMSIFPNHSDHVPEGSEQVFCVSRSILQTPPDFKPFETGESLGREVLLRGASGGALAGRVNLRVTHESVGGTRYSVYGRVKCKTAPPPKILPDEEFKGVDKIEFKICPTCHIDGTHHVGELQTS